MLLPEFCAGAQAIFPFSSLIAIGVVHPRREVQAIGIFTLSA